MLAKRLSTPGWKGESMQRVAATAACFAVVLSVGWIIGPGLFTSPQPGSAADPESRYLGVMRLDRVRQDRCEEFEFDNRSALLTPKSARECRDASERGAVPQTGGTIGRVNGIASHFQHR